MAEDVKAAELLDQLRTQFAEQIRDTVRDLPAHQALQLSDALCQIQLSLLAGLRVHYPAPKKVDGDAVAEDWRRGVPLAEIMRIHKISRTTAYKHHPSPPKRRRRAG